MKPRKAGDGLSGRVQNSGCAWRPTKYLWSARKGARVSDGPKSEGEERERERRRERRTLDLGDLHALAALVAPGELEPLGLDALDVRRVDLVAVAVALPDDLAVAVQLAHLAPLGVALEHGRAQAEPHRAAEVRLGDLGHEDDDRVRGRVEELGGVSVCAGGRGGRGQLSSLARSR